MNEKNLQNGNEEIRLSNTQNSFDYYFSVVLSAIVVVPSLFIMTIAFAVCPICIIGYTFVGLFISLPNIISIGATVFTGIPAFVIAVISSVVLFILATLSWKLLKKYLSFVSNRYQKLHMKNK